MITIHSLLRRAFMKAYDAGVSGAGKSNENRILDQEVKLDEFFNEYPIPEIAFLEGAEKLLPPVCISSDDCASHKWTLSGDKWRCKYCGVLMEGRKR